MYKIHGQLGSTEVFFYDDIGFGGITAKELVMKLKSTIPASDNLILHINSVGGDLGEALGIYNFLKSSEMSKTVYIDGVAASAASIIAMSGDKVIMPESALMMIHNPWTYCEGDSDDMRASAEMLEKWQDICAGIYSEKTGLGHEEIIEMMKSETWMNGLEAKEKGFVDELSGSVRNSVKDAYQEGVRAERERLKALDELMSEGRADEIIKAKYETYKTAEDIALGLLKKETTMHARLRDMKLDAGEVDGVSMKAPMPDEIEAGVKIMNKMRGYE